ncbi:tetratricopeptide repeat protein [Amycolatopsis acidiphila]|nr:AfsR/SARP family transcriptional regulator [Amycolatopsis acidiphila]UIJ57003.1 tetratricopeptide repeat protein [Amycolatopsis acidiphila]GHG53883.1 SARP family transcriptional regulator [Amycolatopsis acidiphila]
MEFRVLGPLEARGDDGPVELGGPRQRAVLAALLLRANSPLSLGELSAAVWDEPPDAAGSNLRTYVARLRRLLRTSSGSRLLTTHAGYQLVLEPGELDLEVFSGHVEQAKQSLAAGDAATAVDCFDRAARLWRGAPLSGAAETLTLRAEADRLGQLRVAVTEQSVRAKLELGRHDEAVSQLRPLTVAYPLAEELWALLMLALYRGGRQADALAVFAEARRRLVHEIGVEPGPRLRRMQERVLAADPLLHEGTRARAGAHHQLPPDIAEFTGREDEFATLRAQLDAAGEAAVVITVVEGMAGVGKTRFAVHAAHRLVRAGRFAEIQLWADLRGFDPVAAPADPGEVLADFLELLGVSRDRVPPALEQRAALYRDRLAGRRVLVLLDNAADEEQVRPLVPGGTAACLVLVTSRRALADLDGAQSLPLDVLRPAEALALLGRIAGADRVEAEPRQSARVVDLCGRLPIALTLAARRLRARPLWMVGTLADRLAADTRRLDELAGRNRAVRASFELSYRGLEPGPRRMFRLLGLHPGDDSTAWAAAALAGSSPDEAEVWLEHLLDEHLVQQVVPGRYRQHDLLRAFAREKADDDAAVRRLLSWYLHTAAAATHALDPRARRAPLDPIERPPHVPAFAGRDEALAWCHAERANLVAAVRVAAEREPALGWRLAASLLGYFYLSKHWDDWLATHHAALGAVAGTERLGEATIRSGLGVACSDLRRFPEALEHHRAAAALFEGVVAPQAQAWNLNNLGVVHSDVHRFAEAAECHRAALEIFRTLGDERGEGISLNNLGDAHRQRHELAAAHDCLRQALALQRRAGDPDAQRFTLCSLGDLHRDLGERDRALGYYREALSLSRERADDWGVARLLVRVADLLDGAQVRRCLGEALEILTGLGDPQADALRARLAQTSP